MYYASILTSLSVLTNGIDWCNGTTVNCSIECFKMLRKLIYVLVKRKGLVKNGTQEWRLESWKG